MRQQVKDKSQMLRMEEQRTKQPDFQKTLQSHRTNPRTARELVKACCLLGLKLKASLLIHTAIFDIPHDNSEGISWQPRDMFYVLYTLLKM